MAGGPWLYATSGTGNLSDVLATLYAAKVQSQINRSSPFPQLVPVRDPGTGKNISFDVAFTNGSGYTNGGVADGADVSVYNSDIKIPAHLEFCTYMDAVAVGGRAQAAAARANNPLAFANLLGYEVMEASRRLAKKIATDFYTGTGASNQIQGLYSETGSTYGALLDSGTHAGINRSTYSEWAANTVDNSGVDQQLSLQLMRDTRLAVYTACGERPDLIVTDPIQFNKYGTLLGQFRQLKQDVTMRGQRVVLDGGFGALDFDGIPVVEDVNHPAGKMSFLNTNYMYIAYMPYAAEGAAGSVEMSGSPEEQFGEGSLKLAATLVPLAKTGDASKIELLSYLQMVVTRCNAQGSLIDLAS